MLDRSSTFVGEGQREGQEGKEGGILASSTMLRRFLNRIRGLGWIFTLTVVLPTIAAILYFGFFASDVYISESRFVVRSPDKPSTSGLGLLLKTAAFSNAGDEIYAAQDFVESRDALRALNKGGAFQRAYEGSSISIFDRFGTFWSGRGFEDLFKYYSKKITVGHDSTSSITTLSVRAYTPQEAERFNEQLLEMAEQTVNRLNVRGRQDLIQFAQQEVTETKRRSQAAALALSQYRNREGVVDPEKQAVVQLQMISKLQDEMISTKNQLMQIRAFAPQNPQIGVLQVKLKALADQIDSELEKVAGDRKSLSSTAAQYQRLVLESQFSDRQLASAMASLEEARNEARRKQAYVERIVQPNRPDEPLEPRRWRSMLATFALGLVAWGVSSMLLAGVREHQA
jgi:capsular polysaccharide transport system permease protein